MYFLSLEKDKGELGVLAFPSRSYHRFPSLVSTWKALLGGPCMVPSWTVSPAQEETYVTCPHHSKQKHGGDLSNGQQQNFFLPSVMGTRQTLRTTSKHSVT